MKPILDVYKRQGEGHAGNDLHPPGGGADDLGSVAAARSGRRQENLRLSPKPMKKLVDEIVDQMARLPTVDACYQTWWELQCQVEMCIRDSLVRFLMQKCNYRTLRQHLRPKTDADV